VVQKVSDLILNLNVYMTDVAARKLAFVHSVDIRGNTDESCIAELQKLPILRDTQSVRIRPYSGPKDWTWELDRIEPEVGPTQIKFVDVATVVSPHFS
jgi:hypothetical protein